MKIRIQPKSVVVSRIMTGSFSAAVAYVRAGAEDIFCSVTFQLEKFCTLSGCSNEVS
jgi:hypothetical protein